MTERISAEDNHARRRVSVRDSEMSYITVGTGVPIVFLHGNSTSSYLWRNVIPHVSDLGWCLAPDLVGMGQSAASPGGAYRFLDHARYLDAWFEALAFHKAVTEEQLRVLYRGTDKTPIARDLEMGIRCRNLGWNGRRVRTRCPPNLMSWLKRGGASNVAPHVYGIWPCRRRETSPSLTRSRALPLEPTEKYLGEVNSLRTPLLMHLGEEDELISKTAQAQIKAALTKKPNATVYSYPGQRHAFSRHNGTHYNAAAAVLANGRTREFPSQHLR